jgi:predicted nucleotide-binding protein
MAILDIDENTWVDAGFRLVSVPMNKDEIISTLHMASLEVINEARNGNDDAWRLDIDCGAIVMLYDTGKIVLQGKNGDPVRAALNMDGGKPTAAFPARQKAARKVFVVYGHDEEARTQLEAMLRRWNLEPLILDQLASGGQTIIEKLESVRKEANFAVILATPDDEGNAIGKPDEKASRARQNVVLELGMMLALLGRPKVAILIKSDVKMERPSDIQGLIYIPYKETVADAKLQLAKEIHTQGLPIDLDRV